jgi:hypothetical protein
MDLKKRLDLGQSKTQTNQIVDYVNGIPIRFKELVEVFLNGPYRTTQRAAWPLSICVEKWPYLIDPHLKKILDSLQKPGSHDAVKRNTMRLLQFIVIPNRYHGKVTNLCFDYLQNPKVAVAIRVFSMTVLLNNSQSQPDIKKELKLILEDHLPFGTAAFKSRATKVLRALSNEGKG